MGKIENKFLAINKSYLGSGLKSIDLLIISHIEEFQRHGNECYITNEQFSEWFGESLSTVKRSLDKLEKLNIIKRNTSFVKGNKASKQRTLAVIPISQWKVHNEPSLDKQGSNVDEARFKSDVSKVHNEPIINNLKNKKINNSIESNANAKEEKIESNNKRSIDDLTDWECNDICRRLKNGELYVTIQKKYNLQFGAITKEFPKWWNQKQKDKALIAQQELDAEERRKQPKIDTNAIWQQIKAHEEKKTENIDTIMDEIFV